MNCAADDRMSQAAYSRQTTNAVDFNLVCLSAHFRHRWRSVSLCSLLLSIAINAMANRLLSKGRVMDVTALRLILLKRTAR
jgi:hypothetical protein